MKRVTNPKKHERTFEYWDKGDGKSNVLIREKRMFDSPDIDDIIRDDVVKIKAGQSAILVDVVAESLILKYPYLIVEDYVKPEKVKKVKKVKKSSLRKYGKKKK